MGILDPIYLHQIMPISIICTDIKTHGSESRGQGGSTLQRPLNGCT